MIIEHNEHPIERIMDNAFVKLKGLKPLKRHSSVTLGKIMSAFDAK